MSFKGILLTVGSALIIGGFILGLQSPAQAVSIRLTDGITTVICGDGDAASALCPGGDITAAAGAVTFSGTIGVWLVNVTTGISFPALGSASFAILDLNSVNVTSSAGGTMTIDASHTGYTGPLAGGIAGPFAFNVGGTTVGSATYTGFLDDPNVLFGTGTLLGTLGPFGPGAFSGSLTASAAAVSPFALTIRGVIVHPGSGGTSFNAELTPKVPEPATLFLMGTALAGLFFFRGRLRPVSMPG